MLNGHANRRNGCESEVVSGSFDHGQTRQTDTPFLKNRWTL